MNVSSDQIQGLLDQWQAEEIIFSGDLSKDTVTLSEFCQAGESILSQLPIKLNRTNSQSLIANALHESTRNARKAFLVQHAEAVYNQLTANKSKRLKLKELVFAASTQFPGLVPTKDQMAQEATYIQSEKEGRELDQGIFFSFVLKNVSAGEHLMDSMRQPSQESFEILSDFTTNGVVDFGKVKIERIDSAAHITFLNPSCLNAEDNELIEAFETAVDLALLDENTHVVVLRGNVVDHPKYAGRRIFSAGINLKNLHQGKISFVDFLLQRELGYISKMQRGLLVDKHGIAGIPKLYEKPFIAAVDTFAIGGGCQLLFVCDHVIAARDSYLNLPAAKEGIIPGLGNLRLTRAVGTRIARQIVLKGRTIWASEDDAKLLVDEVVAPNQMDSAIDRAVVALDNPAVVSNRHMFPLTEEPYDMFRSYMAEFAWVQAERAYSPDVMDKVKKM